MAAIAQQRREYLDASRAKLQEIHQATLDLIELDKQGNTLVYRHSPLISSSEFLSRIPHAVARLVSSLALAILFAPFALVCGKFSTSRPKCRQAFQNIKLGIKEIPILIYAALIPSKGIERNYRFMVRRENLITGRV